MSGMDLDAPVYDPEPVEHLALIGEFDGQVWAKTFVKTVLSNPAIPTDADTMLAWFASAIMAGYDRAANGEQAVLRWTCESCGWSVLVPMPGYAGDGYNHATYAVAERSTMCGPLVARREPGLLRARPGESLPDNQDQESAR